MPPGGRVHPPRCTQGGLRATAVMLIAAIIPLARAHASPEASPAEAAVPDPTDLDTSLVIRAVPVPDADAPETSTPSETDPFAVPPDAVLPARPIASGPLVLSLETAEGNLPDLASLAPETGAARDPFSVRFGRANTLGEGGFDARGGIDDAGGGYFTDGHRFDRYNLDLEWTPSGADASLQWLVLGGFDAVRADINGDPRLGLTDARGTVAIPTIGTGLRWRPNEAIVFSTTASTQTLDTGGGVVDISFNAEFRLAPNVGLSAGYEFYESSMTVENLRTTLDREGVFAKLTIRF